MRHHLKKIKMLFMYLSNFVQKYNYTYYTFIFFKLIQRENKN